VCSATRADKTTQSGFQNRCRPPTLSGMDRHGPAWTHVVKLGRAQELKLPFYASLDQPLSFLSYGTAHAMIGGWPDHNWATGVLLPKRPAQRSRQLRRCGILPNAAASPSRSVPRYGRSRELWAAAAPDGSPEQGTHDSGWHPLGLDGLLNVQRPLVALLSMFPREPVLA
jgi:hypothetical protein